MSQQYQKQKKKWFEKGKEAREKEILKIIDEIPRYEKALDGIFIVHNKINWRRVFLLRLKKELKSKLQEKERNHSPLSNIQDSYSEKVVPSHDKIEDTKNQICRNCGKIEQEHFIRCGGKAIDKREMCYQDAERIEKFKLQEKEKK